MTQPADPLAGKNYRIRGIEVRMVIDLYNNEGARIDTASAEPLGIQEADIPKSLSDILTTRTGVQFGLVVAPRVPPPDGGS